jgi:hypothetical protein
LAQKTAMAAMSLSFLLANCAGSHGSAPASSGQISSRAIEAVALFGEYCLEVPPSVTAIDRRALASGFKVFQDRAIGPDARQKEWLVPTPEGAALLLSVEGGPSRDGTADVTVCGVSALGAPGLDLKHALSGDRRLGEPTKVLDPAPGGGTLVFWSTRFSGPRRSDAQVMLTYDVPGLGVNPINLTFRQQH